MALGNVGADGTIESLSDQSTVAKRCKLWYEPARKQALAAFDWSFARKSQVLATHADAAPSGWTYRYQYPADCVKVRLIANPLDPQQTNLPPVPYKVMVSSDGNTKTICTNQPEAEAIYTFDQSNTDMFTEFFTQVLAALLAFYIAYATTGKRTVKQDMWQMYTGLINAASGLDANEEKEAEPGDAAWIQGR
jgi:carboxylesterase type B